MAASAWYWATQNRDAVLGSGRGALEAQLAYAWDAAMGLLFLLTIGLAIIAAVDYPLQRFQRNNRLKMSLKELRDETKQAEGSPEMKGARKPDGARGIVCRHRRAGRFRDVAQEGRATPPTQRRSASGSSL